MRITENIALAFSSIRRNRLRTALTGMIIAIGIMALVGILTSIDGLKYFLGSQFSTLGSNTIAVSNVGMKIEFDTPDEDTKVHPPITYREAQRFKSSFPYDYPVSIQVLCGFTSTVEYRSKKTTPNIFVWCSDENFIKTEGHEVTFGRNFSAREVRDGDAVCLLGWSTAKGLFRNPDNALGKSVQVDNRRYQVIGVLKEKGSTLLVTDKFVVVPVGQGKKQYELGGVSYNLHLFIPESERIPEISAEAAMTMRKVRKTEVWEEDDFEISSSVGMTEDLLEMTSRISIGGFVISLIALVGAAIGLMNIMLVSVTERTREIGTLKAIGARPADILFQFLMEAMLICILGGLFGIILGVTAGNLVSSAMGGSFNIPWLWIGRGLAFCILVGLVSGIYPALQAAEKDPVESLRYE